MKESEPDDTSLIHRIARQDTEAISDLFDRYNRLVFSVAMAIIGERVVAEEITLDVFVRIWRRAGTYDSERAKVSTWLIAITRHHAIDVLRWQNSRPESNSLGWEEASAVDRTASRGLEERVDSSIERQRVRQAVAQLPVDQREALGLAYFRGYTHTQIAELLKEPLGTVKTRIRLAMQKLRKILNED